MKNSLLSFLLIASFGPLVSIAGHAETTAATVTEDAKTKLFKLLDKDTTAVAFTPKSSVLSKSESSNLSAVVNGVRSKSVISRVIVAAWSDQEYPATKGTKLTKAQHKIAEDRAAKVKQALDSLGVKDVETYTMTEKPTWLGKLFNTDDAKVKGEGKIKDSEDKMQKEIGKTLRDKGGPGKVVVIVRRSTNTVTE